MQTLVAVVGETGLGRTGGEQYDARLLAAAKQAGFGVSYITWQGSTLDKLMGLPLLWRLRFITRTLSLTWQLYRSSGDVFIDVWLAPYVSFWAKRTSRKIILMVHHLRGELEKNRKLQVAETVLIQHASRLLTVSQSSKQHVLEYRDGDVPISVIPPGFVRPDAAVDTVSKSQQKQVHFLFVGHITKAKGVLDALEAVALLHDNNWFLHVVGGASAEPETWGKVASLIKKHGLGEHVQLYGRVDDNSLLALYKQADVFVLPSYWEGYGIVFLEAMSFGLPVVSTTAGAIPEVVKHNKAGLLVEPGDVRAMAQALQKFVDEPETRFEFAQYAMQSVKAVADWDETEQTFVSWWQKRADDVG